MSVHSDFEAAANADFETLVATAIVADHAVAVATDFVAAADAGVAADFEVDLAVKYAAVANAEFEAVAAAIDKNQDVLPAIWTLTDKNEYWFHPAPNVKQIGLPVDELPETLQLLNLTGCEDFSQMVEALRVAGWDESCPSPGHWNFHKDGWWCRASGPGANAEFNYVRG